jgi:hypothetical protein
MDGQNPNPPPPFEEQPPQGAPAPAPDPQPVDPIAALMARLDRLEEQNADLQAQNQQLHDQLDNQQAIIQGWQQEEQQGLLDGDVDMIDANPAPLPIPSPGPLPVYARTPPPQLNPIPMRSPRLAVPQPCLPLACHNQTLPELSFLLLEAQLPSHHH